MPTHTLTIKKPKATKAKGPAPIQRAGTHVWLSVDEFLPSNGRCVFVSDGEGVFIGCYDRLRSDPPLPDAWQDAQTEEEFDSVITHWRELPDLPVI